MSILFPLATVLALAGPMTACGRSSDAHATPYTVAAPAPSRDSLNSAINGGRRNAITTAVAKASPAVVGINVTETREIKYQAWNPFSFGDDPFFQQFFPDEMRRQFGGGGIRTQQYQVKALGSGFIISPDGYVLTNDHVAGNATKVIITTTAGDEYDAKVIGTDHVHDITLLKIDGKGLPYLTLGNSKDLLVGEWAIALGNPFGLFSTNNRPTVTVGVLSNTNVNLGLEGGYNYRDMIQTDAAISSGNSGGPLLNASGEVIGMNAVIRSTAQSQEGAGSIGLGFAIPIDRIKTIIDRLRTGEKIDRDLADIGIAYADASDERVQEYFQLKSSNGVVVTQTRRGGAGERAGIEPGDLVVALDAEKIRSLAGLQSALADHDPGDEVTFHILRDGKKRDVTVTLPRK